MTDDSTIRLPVQDDPDASGATGSVAADAGSTAIIAPDGPTEADPTVADDPRVSLLLPLIVAVGVVGLAIVAAINGAARDGTRTAQLFWIGLVVIVLPPVVRLLGARVGRTERLTLVVWLGLALYAIKALGDPWLVYSDEWVHRYNAAEAVATGRLFHANSTIPVTGRYPGLAGLTAMLTSSTGLSVAGAGLVLVAVARLLFVIALFVVLERATGSPRAAGIGCAFYAAAPNFVFWSAQYAYESLALPLLLGLLAIVSVLLRDVDDSADGVVRRRGLALIAGLDVLLIVVTHHVTAYAMIIVLVAIPLTARVRGRAAPDHSIIALAALSIAATAAWLAFVASNTFTYVDFIFRSAADSLWGTITQSGDQRALFQSGHGTVTPPLGEQGVAILGVVVLLAFTVLGFRRVWRWRADPFVLILFVFGLAYFASLGLRFSPGAWETGNRASSILFVGLVVIVGVGAMTAVDGEGRRRLRIPGVAVATVVAIASGVIAGWPTDLRLPWTYRAEAKGATLDPQPVAVARWFGRVAPPGARVFADETNGRTLPVFARVATYAGRQPYVAQIYASTGFPRWQVDTFARLGLGFAVEDDRTISGDNVRGYYFPTPGADASRRPAPFVSKFDGTGGSRIVDTGDIAIYDLRSVVGANAR